MENKEIVEKVLQGDINTASTWAIPRLVKIFISANKQGFVGERKCLLENIGPELQAAYDATGIEVELVDMHYGFWCDPLKDPILYAHQLKQISLCQETSRGCFFICLLGNEDDNAPLPLEIDEQLFENLRKIISNTTLLEESYVRLPNTNLYQLNRSFNVEAELIERTTKAIREAARLLSAQGISVNPQLIHSAIQHQLYHAIKLDAEHVVVVNVNREKVDDGNDTKEYTFYDSTSVQGSIPRTNIIYLSTKNGQDNVEEEDEDEEEYLTNFQEGLTLVLQNLINRSIQEKPEVNARNKAVQEIFKESLIHLAYCKTLLNEIKINWKNTEIFEKIQKITLKSTSNGKHGPIIIEGKCGCGKTSLLTAIYENCYSWFELRPTTIIRFSGITPRSSYNLELLRVICEQVNLLLQPDGLCVPRDASFDPLYVYNWFQELLKQVEIQSTILLVILIDDLHQLNPQDSDIVAALSWLPTILPLNVHIFCTTLSSPEILKMTPLQKERFKTSEILIKLPVSENKEADIDAYVSNELDKLEEQFGEAAVSRFASFISISEFGLSETEMLELLMPTTGGMECVLNLEDGYFNFSTYNLVKQSAAKTLVIEKFMSGRLLVCWRHKSTNTVVRKRYLSSQQLQRQLHTEIVNVFFSDFTSLEINEEQLPKQSQQEDDIEKSTLLEISCNNVRYSLRHVEESWIHLLKAGDNIRLKEYTLCNFDFLLAAVRTISVSYLRSILEHARFYLLDRDVELIYYTIRKSSSVLTRDTLQLGAQIICWLRSVPDCSILMKKALLSAMAWCDGYTDPIIIPLNHWMQPPLPLYVKAVTCGTIVIRDIQPTPSAQHIVVLPMGSGDAELWHAMSNTLIHTFKGHSGAVLCVDITKDSHYLLTGSEDTSVIVWDLRTFQMNIKITEHIAAVVCVTSNAQCTLVISGGEDSRIIISCLNSGRVINKIDHHRGPVTSVLYSNIGDVLVSGSVDKCVCVWDLDTFSLLNTINVPSAVTCMQISKDSIFLLIACEDNQMYLHTVATGTLIHTLRAHKAKVQSICLANDNQRAIVGSNDSRVYVLDMRTGGLMIPITTAPHHTHVTALKVTTDDNFLITAGDNRLAYWNFRNVGIERVNAPLANGQSKKAHSLPITCVDISADGTVAVTGAMDWLVNVWQLNAQDTYSTMEGHIAPVTCVAIAPNCLFAASGSEDKTVRVWGLTLGTTESSFEGHEGMIVAIEIMADSRKVVSTDKLGKLAVWMADDGVCLFRMTAIATTLAVTNDMKHMLYAESSCSLQIRSISDDSEANCVLISHSEEITCFTLTHDSKYVVTGSKDMSLKVWQVDDGKLTQVLVGHTAYVNCVAVAVLNKSIVVSGSWDSHLIIWDIETGLDVHLLSGHLGHVTCVKLSADGTLAVSGSDDKKIIVWDTKRGVILTSMQLHLPIMKLVISSDLSRIVVHLYDCEKLAILSLHNTTATYVKPTVYQAPTKQEIRCLPKSKIPNRRLLKKDVSLDSYTWQRKYAHLTTSLMMAAVDEKLSRRFSVSASMEEISTISSRKEDETMGSQGLGPEKAALAQSQHFDQLQALWNKKSPQKTRKNQLSKQSSRSSRYSEENEDDSDQEM